MEPMAINSLLAKLGTSDAIEARLSLAELVADFDMAKISRGAPKFDPEELKRLNARVLHATPFQSVASRLTAMGFAGVDEGFWNAVRPNLSRLADIAEWWHVAREPISARDRRSRLRRRRVIPAAGRALGRHDLEHLDQCCQNGDRPQRKSLVHAPASGPDRPGSWTRTQEFVTSNRPRTGKRPARRTGLLRINRCRSIFSIR